VAGKKLTLEIERGLGGSRSDLLDLYWMARHGHPIPDQAWPAVLAARHSVEGTYMPAEMLLSLLLKEADNG